MPRGRGYGRRRSFRRSFRGGRRRFGKRGRGRMRLRGLRIGHRL